MQTKGRKLRLAVTAANAYVSVIGRTLAHRLLAPRYRQSGVNDRSILFGIASLLCAVAASTSVSLPEVAAETAAASNLTTVVQSGIRSPHVSLAAFDQSGDYLAVASPITKEVTVWHIPSRLLMHRFWSTRSQLDVPNRLQFTANPIRVVLESAHIVEQWNVESEGFRSELVQEPEFTDDFKLVDTPANRLSAHTVSRSGQIIATARIVSGQPEVAVSTVTTGKTHTFKSPFPVYSITVAPDDQLLAVVNPIAVMFFDIQGKAVALWRNDESRRLSFQSVEFSDDKRLTVIRARQGGKRISIVRESSTGKTLKQFEHERLDDHLAMLPGQKTVLISRSSPSGTLLEPLELDTERTRPWGTSDELIMALAVHQATELIAIVSATAPGTPPFIDLIESANGARIGRMQSSVERTGPILFDSATNQLLETGHAIHHWDLSKGKRQRIGDAVGGSPLIAHDGRILYSQNVGLAIFSVTGNQRAQFKLSINGLRADNAPPFCATRNLKWLATVQGDEIRVISIPSGKVHSTIRRKTTADSSRTQVSVMCLTDDGSHLALCDHDGNVELWSTSSRKLLFSKQDSSLISRLNPKQSSVDSIVSDKRGFLLMGEFGCLALETEGKLKQLKTGLFGHQVEVSPSGDRFACVDLQQSTVEVVERNSLRVIAKLPCLPTELARIAFTNDPRELLIQRFEGDIEVWRVDSSSLSARLVPLPKDGYLIVTPDGFYKTDRPNVQSVAFRSEATMLSADQFERERNRPDIVLERLDHVDESYLDLQRAVSGWRGQFSVLEHQPPPQDRPHIRFAKRPPISTSQRKLAIHIAIEPSNTSIRNVYVSINGIPTNDQQLAHAEVGDDQAHSLNIALTPGVNRVLIHIEDTSGRRSRKLSHVVYCLAEPEPSAIWYVGIGISKYADPQYDLNLAAKDSMDLAAVLSESSHRQFNALVITDQQAELQNVTARVSEFVKRAAPSDLLIVFVAGHGFLDKNKYYFALHQCEFLTGANGRLSLKGLEDLICASPARSRILLLDTCHAGEVLPTDFDINKRKRDGIHAISRSSLALTAGPKINQSRQFRELLFNQFARDISVSGTAVIAASDGGQFAFESSRWQNGAFTYAIREGLISKKADINDDSVIRIGELSRFVEQRVLELTLGEQSPQARYLNPVVDPAVIQAVQPDLLPATIPLVAGEINSPRSIAVNAHASMLAVGFSGEVRIVNLNSGEIRVSDSASEDLTPYRLQFVDGGQSLLVHEYQNRLSLVDVATGERRVLLPSADYSGYVPKLEVSRDGKRAIAVNLPEAGLVTVWEFENGVHRTVIDSGKQFFASAWCLLPDDHTIRAIHSDVIHDLSLKSGAMTRIGKLARPKAAAEAKFFSCSGKFLVFAPSDRAANAGVSIWGIPDMKKLTSSTDRSVAAVILPDGPVALSGFRDTAELETTSGPYSVLNARTGALSLSRISVATGERSILSKDHQLLALRPDQALQAAKSIQSHGIRVVRLSDATEVAWLQPPRDDFYRATFSPDGKSVFAVDSNGQLYRWRLRKHQNGVREGSIRD